MLTSHAFFCVLGGIPIAVWTYYVGRKHRRTCIPVALLVAFSIPWYFNYWNKASIEHSRIAWIRPFLGSTFGFSTAFKLWPTLKKNPMGLPWCLAYGLLTLVAVGVLRWPMVWVVLGLGSAAVATAWRKLGR